MHWPTNAISPNIAGGLSSAMINLRLPSARNVWTLPFSSKNRRWPVSPVRKNTWPEPYCCTSLCRSRACKQHAGSPLNKSTVEKDAASTRVAERTERRPSIAANPKYLQFADDSSRRQGKADYTRWPKLDPASFHPTDCSTGCGARREGQNAEIT